jgi:hypothetical protein
MVCELLTTIKLVTSADTLTGMVSVIGGSQPGSSNDVAVVVVTCDVYSDLWEPFIKCFENYWPDCPYSKYLVTETLHCDVPFFAETFTAGRVIWTDRLNFALSRINQDNLIVLCEDYLLCDRVSNEKIQLFVDVLKKYGAGNLRLSPSPFPDHLLPGEDGIGKISKGTQYRISTQVGIWNRQYLLQFTDLHVNAWNFERIGSAFSNNLEPPILSTTKQFFPFIDSVHKGKWEIDGVQLCERNNISIDFSHRRAMTNFDYVIKHGKGLIIDLAPKLITNLINVKTQIKRLFSARP